MLSAEPKAEADNTYRDLDYLGLTKTESNNCSIIHCFEENNDKRIITAITVYFQTLTNVQLSDKQIFTVFIKQSSALGSHALRAQPTDYSLICRYRLVNNL